MKQHPGYVEAVYIFLQSLEDELHHHELSMENLPDDEDIQQNHGEKITELKLRIEQVTNFIHQHKIMRE